MVADGIYMPDIPVWLSSWVHTSPLSSLLLCCVWWKLLRNLASLGNLSGYPEPETGPFGVRRKTSVCLKEHWIKSENQNAGSMGAHGQLQWGMDFPSMKHWMLKMLRWAGYPKVASFWGLEKVEFLFFSSSFFFSLGDGCLWHDAILFDRSNHNPLHLVSVYPLLV